MVVWLLRLLLRLLLLLLLTLLLLLQQLLLLLSKVGATPVRACLLLVLVSSPLFRHASAPVVPHTVVTPARPKWCACVSVHVSARVLAYVCVCMCVCACKMSSMKHAQFKPPTSFAVLHVAPNISTLPSALAALCTQFCYVLPCCTLLMHCNASTQRPCYAHFSCITMPLHKGPAMHTTHASQCLYTKALICTLLPGKSRALAAQRLQAPNLTYTYPQTQGDGLCICRLPSSCIYQLPLL
jgi:hypothetical protein